jgi:hypothetical protein
MEESSAMREAVPLIIMGYSLAVLYVHLRIFPFFVESEIPTVKLRRPDD